MAAAILAIPTSSSEDAPRRYVGVVTVGAFHIAALYVFLTALNILPSPIPDTDVRFRSLPPDRPPAVTNPMPPVGTPDRFAQPEKPEAHEPIIKTADNTPHLFRPPQNPGAGEGRPTLPQAGVTAAARGIADTHTIPRYPMIALRLGHEGDVRLKLTIDEHGGVIGAELLNSSGHDELDDAAIAWVKAHWRYTPALQNGNPVQSNMNVVVTFRLDQAR